MKRKSLDLIVLLLVFLMFPLCVFEMVGAQKIVWNTNPTPLPVPLIEHESVVYNGKIYVIGGSTTDTNWRTAVYFANILVDGSVGTWLTTTPLPQARADHCAVVWNGFIYVLGGTTTGITYLDTVLYAQIQPDGNLGNWLLTTSLPTTVAGYASAIWNGRIYAIIGGWPGWKGEVYFAKINADGSLGNWNPATSLPEPRRAPTVAVRNGIMYVIGGQYPERVYHNTVYYATIDPATGEVGAWSTTAPFPTNMQQAREVLIGDDIYIIGGDDGSVAFDTVYGPKINAGDSIHSWTQMNDSLPEPRTIHASVVYDRRIYVLGGSTTGGGIKSTIYYSSQIPLPPPETSLWMQWWFWAIIALGVIAAVLAFTTVHYLGKASKSKETNAVPSKTMPKDIKVCPKCGANLPAGSKFCGKCGTSLE
jgi:N-acetylneuraminic acid mutarotase